MGILHPVLRAKVGDTLEVVFLNRLGEVVGCHPHGMEYDKASESAPYADGSTPAQRRDDGVAPGANVTLTWRVPDTAGPGPAEPSTIAWLYHSHTDEIAGPYSGLVGAIIVGRLGAFARDRNGALGAAADAEVETVALFAVMDERQSYLWPRNVEKVKDQDEALKAGNATASVDSDASEDSEAQLLHAINGYVYCNGPELRVRRGDRLRLHVLAIGTEVDLHSPTLEGATLEIDGQRGPAAVALPGSMQTVDIAVDAPTGSALLQCRVADHVAAGMQAIVRVVDAAAVNNATAATTANTITAVNGTAASGVTRSYAIQAEETLWDYVGTTGKNACPPGGAVPFTDAQKIFVKTDATIGSAYTKAVYSRYENDTFDRCVPVLAFHGLLGPIQAAGVGDVLEVAFRNALSFDVNLRLDGGFVPLPDYADPAAAVPPNATVTYRMLVPAAAGPGPADLNTVAYKYGSSVDYVTHPMAGLVGIALHLLTPSTGSAAMPAEPVPAGTGGLLPLVAAVFNENESPFFEENAKGLDAGVADGAAEGEAEGEGEASPGADFYESNLMHALNGFLWCNAPRYEFDAAAGAPLRVAVLALGSETDLHSLTVAGQALVGAPVGSPRGALEPLLPAVAMSADIAAPLQPGVWPIQCAVHDHMDAGIHAHLEVKGAATSAAAQRSVAAGAIATAAGLVLMTLLL